MYGKTYVCMHMRYAQHTHLCTNAHVYLIMPMPSCTHELTEAYRKLQNSRKKHMCIKSKPTINFHTDALDTTAKTIRAVYRDPFWGA